MRFLANENISLATVGRLRAAGHDVAAVSEEAPGAPDTEVLARACQEQRLILTFDRDYGELVYHRALPAPPGIVYFRFRPSTPEEPAEHLLGLVTAGQPALENQLTVVERGQVRQRALP
jgi:predicted nuclease of predicted toxin-antitoxin system